RWTGSVRRNRMWPRAQRKRQRETLPALMHEVQAFTRFGVPPTTVRTRWMFGFQRRDVRRCECEMLLPKPGPLPQTSQLAATGHSKDFRCTYGGSRHAGINTRAPVTEPLGIRVALPGETPDQDRATGAAYIGCTRRTKLPWLPGDPPTALFRRSGPHGLRCVPRPAQGGAGG